jgi:hypothetical protein
VVGGRHLLATHAVQAICAQTPRTLTWDYLHLMSTPDHRRHFGALGATASDIKVSSGGRELLSGMPEGTVFFANEPIHGAVVALSVTPAPIDRRARGSLMRLAAIRQL